MLCCGWKGEEIFEDRISGRIGPQADRICAVLVGGADVMWRVSAVRVLSGGNTVGYMATRWGRANKRVNVMCWPDTCL